MHRIPISGIENKKCGTVTGVGVNTLSYYRISSKPRVTNYTYESLQRALYSNNPKYDGWPGGIASRRCCWPSATAVKELAKYRICKTVTLNNKVLIPNNVYLYIPPCVTLNILQSGSIITDGGGEEKNILTGGGLVNSGTINNRGTINNNGGQIINTTGSLITNYGIITDPAGDIFNDFYSDGVGGTIDTRYGKTVGMGPEAGTEGTVLGEWGVDNR